MIIFNLENFVIYFDIENIKKNLDIEKISSYKNLIQEKSEKLFSEKLMLYTNENGGILISFVGSFDEKAFIKIENFNLNFDMNQNQDLIQNQSIISSYHHKVDDMSLSYLTVFLYDIENFI